MIRAVVVLILIGFAATACTQTLIFGKCSPFSASNARCAK